MAVSPTHTPRNRKTIVGGLVILAVILVNYLLYPNVGDRLALSVVCSLLFLLPRGIVTVMVRPMTITRLSDARVVINSAWLCCLCGVMVAMTSTPPGTYALIIFQGALLGHLTHVCGKAKRSIAERHEKYRATR